MAAASLIPELFPAAFLISPSPFELFPVPFSFYGGCTPLPGSAALGNKQIRASAWGSAVSRAYGPSQPQSVMQPCLSGTTRRQWCRCKRDQDHGRWLQTPQEQTAKSFLAPPPYDCTSALRSCYRHSLEVTGTLLLSQDFVHERFLKV